MELKDLRGLHMFSGIDYISQSSTKDLGVDEDCEMVHFILDGITYTAIQYAEDGYRSSMYALLQDKVVVKNVFEPVPVLARLRSEDAFQKNDVLEVCNFLTGEIIFAVGTENTNDYYPCWVASFHPENI